MKKLSKKLRIERDSHLFCKLCHNLDEKREEMVVLTDPRLNSLYPSSSDNSLNVDTPQHRITQFSIHDSDRRLCWFDSKPIEDGYELFLCGYVEPIVSHYETEVVGSEEEMKSKENPIVAQMFGPLQEWWFAGFDGGQNMIIGVESEFASYILCQPNEDYLNLFTKCTKNMFLTKLIIESLLKNPDSCYEDLLLSIEEREQDFTEESIIQFSPFIVEQIRSFDSAAEKDDNILSECQAFNRLVELSNASSKSKDLMHLKRHISHVRPIARIDSRRAVNSDTMTCATPLVTTFFDMFKDVIESETNNSQQTNGFESNAIKKRLQMLSNELSKKINWIGNTVYEDKFARTSYYSTLRINDFTYNLGDFVVFSQNDNSLNLGRIMFMFSTSDKSKFCHIHYFCHGKDTILAETAPNFLVFMTTNCDNIEVERIEHKLDILLTNELELNSEKDKSEGYLCSKLYYEKCGRFEDLPPEVFNSDLKCINCLMNERKEKQNIPQLDEEVIEGSNDSTFKRYQNLIYRNEKYSVSDCTLFSSDAFDINYFNYSENQQICDNNEEYDQTLYPERYRKQFTDYSKRLNNDIPKTLNIGVIVEIFKSNSDSIEETKLLINVFYRPQNIHQNYSEFCCCDLNLVFWSNHKLIVGINSLRGKCQVIYSKQSPETDIYIETKLFYFNRCYDFEGKTFSEPNEELINRFMSNNKDIPNVCRSKLNVLDLFAGCGGLSYGFDKLGLVSNLWAIEKDCSAVESFKANFKSAHVFQEDVNHILNQLIKGVKYDKNGQKFPTKGEIDLILGGPPCQGFSGMNRFSSGNYSKFKNSLVVSFLSYVDFYRPKYLIFENVRNLSLFRHSMILKLMLSCLISMGYQCHTAILQSGSYGLPQTRRRTVIIGASTGYQLPSFPEPTHVFSRRLCQLSVTIDNKTYSARSKRSCAQFRTISIDDAISDLPELGENYTSNEVLTYKSSHCMTHYQKLLRKGCDNRLHDHYCKELGELCRLRIKNIPQRLDSDWRDLPNISLILKDGTVIPKLIYSYNDLRQGRSKSNELRGVCLCAQGLKCGRKKADGKVDGQTETLIPWCLVHTANRNYHWQGLYGRLALSGYFPTTVTNPEPISKQGRVLHPTQDRIISIRESARSQGFPDSFLLCGPVSDKYRQIGNAVPIPLSLALSRQFLTIV